MRNKRAGEKYYILISLILGILILGLALWFIFHEYFTEEELNWEACRQSIVLRSGHVANALKYLQQNFPFKCKTQVIEINNDDPNEVMKKVADTMASCWYLFGEGKLKLYPDGLLETEKIGFVCARIHFGEKTKKIKKDMFFWRYLNTHKTKDGKTYGDYIYHCGAFCGNAPQLWVLSGKGQEWAEYALLTFPEKLYTDEGDLLIALSYHKDETRIFTASEYFKTGYFLMTPCWQGTCPEWDRVETIPA
jgi:hypothetical protein